MDDERRMEVSRVVVAPAGRIFAFLRVPGNHRRFDTSGMVRGAVGDAAVAAVGDVFTMAMHNDERGEHTVDNHVVVHEPGRALGWAPAEPGHAPAGHTWTWRLEPLDDTRTLVRLLHDWSRFSHLDALDRLPVVDRDGLLRSVDLLAAAIAADGDQGHAG